MRSGSSWYCVVTGKTLSWEDVTGKHRRSARAERQRKERREKTDERHQAIDGREHRFTTMMSASTAIFTAALSEVNRERHPVTLALIAKLCDVSASQALSLMQRHHLRVEPAVVVTHEQARGIKKQVQIAKKVATGVVAKQTGPRCSKCNRLWQTLRSGEINPICRYPGCPGDPVTT